MKILHVINSLAGAGAENLVVTLANVQIESHEVSLFTFNSKKDFFSRKLNRGIKYYSFKKSGFFSLKKILLLRKVISENDIIHVHLFPSFYIVCILAFFSNKKFIYTEHSTTNKRRKLFLKPIEKIIYSRYSCIICISNSCEHNLRCWLGNNLQTTVIKNVIDLNEIKYSLPIKKNEISIKEENRVLVMVGRFQSEKDQDTLVLSLKILPTNYILLLIGEGERINEVKELVRTYSLENRVHFLGLRNDVFNILKSCDYGILSSHMACGIPALGTNVEGLNEVIPVKENLFNVGDYKYLAKRILQIESGNVLKNSIITKQNKFLLNFDVDSAVKLHEEVYMQKF